jgi:hypothetical protein
MNKQQTKYFRMMQSTQVHLDNHSALWSTIPKIVAIKNDIDEIITRISIKSDDISGMVGVSERKEALKGIIAMKGSRLAGTLEAFAHEQGDKDMIAKVSASKTDILRMKEEDLGPFIKFLTDTASQHMTALADYGMTGEVLNELQTSLDEYSALIGKPRIVLNSKYVALDAIDELVDEGNNLLSNRLDKIMLMFRESDPDFYNGYKRARVIVDL